MTQPIKIYFLLLFSIFYSLFTAHAQFSAGPNDTINPGVPVNLTATYGQIGVPVQISDDGVKGPFPVGFDFRFFGNVFNQFYIGANGWISFTPNPNSSGIRNTFAVPSAAPAHPKNAILGPWQDFSPAMNDTSFTVYYLTMGDSPDRVMVVMWCQVPMFSQSPIECNDSVSTFQIILHENSNIVESQIFKKASCPVTNGNKATLGLQNSTGSIGYAVPGYNATSWAADREGWTFTPTTVDTFEIAQKPYHLQPLEPADKVIYTWYKGTELIGTGQGITVSPAVTTDYIAKLNLCDGEEFIDTVTVFVIPFIPNAFTPNGDGLNDHFRIIGILPENITKFNLQIFNRWGQVVFTSSNILNDWDGTLKGELCPEGVYPWIMYYEDGKKIKVTNKGIVTLVR